MTWGRLASLVGSGHAGPLALREYRGRSQVRNAPPQVFYAKGSPHAHDKGAAVSGGPRDHNITPADVNKPRHADPKNVSGTKRLPTHGTPPNSAKGNPHGGSGGGAGGGGFAGMLAQLLGQANTGKMLPSSLASMAAGPDTAMANTLQDQINQLPSAKQQALANISDWYGQVSKAEDTAASRDQSMADAGSAAMQDATKGIMSSLGGSAMAGSGQIGAMGANDANTLQAIGASDKQLSSDLAPIFDLAAASAKTTRSRQYDSALQNLQDQLGQAQGQGQADKAAALQAIMGANNSTRQSNYSNKAGLLNTLAGLQISGMNAASNMQYKNIENALHASEIQKNLKSATKSKGGLASMTPTERADLVNKITQGLVDPNSHKLIGGMTWPDALRAARNAARSAGLNPFGTNVIGTVIGPALSNAGITAQGGGFWPAIYQP